MFGVPARLGLASTTLPASMYEDVTSEEELNEAWISFSQQLPILKRLSGYKIQDDRYPCDQCDHVSPTAYNLKRHVKARHPLYAESIQVKIYFIFLSVSDTFQFDLDPEPRIQLLIRKKVKKIFNFFHFFSKNYWNRHRDVDPFLGFKSRDPYQFDTVPEPLIRFFFIDTDPTEYKK